MRVRRYVPAMLHRLANRRLVGRLARTEAQHAQRLKELKDSLERVHVLLDKANQRVEILEAVVEFQEEVIARDLARVKAEAAIHERSQDGKPR